MNTFAHDGQYHQTWQAMSLNDIPPISRNSKYTLKVIEMMSLSFKNVYKGCASTYV